MINVCISSGNIKMGKISSVSLDFDSCRNCECKNGCYAKKIARLRKTVAESYKRNSEILKENPDQFWREVEAAIMLSTFFRFHVAGDIPDMAYLIRIVKIAERNPHCKILCFTKKYEIVNTYLNDGNSFPKNLKIVLSYWRSFVPENPHNLPTAHVRFRDGFTTASDNAKECGGNCFTCAETKCGCWDLKPGEQVVFKQH